MPTPSALTVLLTLALASTAAAAETPSWKPVGWGGGAYYFAAAWCPADSGTLYLGGDCAGIYRSENQARQWHFANVGLTDYAVYCLATGPADPDLVYALTDGGLFKSTDRAKSWTFIAASAASANDIRSNRSGSVRAVAIDPTNADVVYAGARNGRLWKTADGGATWNELAYRDALPAPADAPTYSGTGCLQLTWDSSAESPDAIGRISRISNQGKSGEDWSASGRLSAQVRVPAGAPAVQAQVVVQSGSGWTWQGGPWVDCAAGWTEVALDLGGIADRSDVRMVHVALRITDPSWKGEISVDAVTLHPTGKGEAVSIGDWEAKGDSQGWVANRQTKDGRRITAAKPSQGAVQRGTVSGVAVASDGAVYVTNTHDGAFRSDDGGTTWAALSAPRKALSVTVSPLDPAVVWVAGGTAGTARSSDRGATWTVVHPGGAKEAVREIALHAQAPDRVYAIANDGWSGGFYRSDDNGVTWTKTTRTRMGLPGNPTTPDEHAGHPPGFCGLSTVTNIAVDPSDPDTLFLSGNWRNHFSSDGGKTFEERSTGADNTCATDIQFHDGKTYVTAMDEGLLVTADSGGTWTQLVPLKYDPLVSGHFWRVRVAAVDDATRIVTTCSPWNSFGDPTLANRILVSDDGGKAFTTTTTGLPNRVPKPNTMWGRSFPRALAQHPTDPNVLYLGMDGDAEGDHPAGGIFRSADGGQTWTRCAGQPGSRRMYYGLAIDPSNPKRLFWSACGDGGGTWRSEDEGATWTHVFKTDTWSFNCEVTPAGRVLVGGKDLHISDDHGATWTKATAFGDSATVVGIAVDPEDEQRIWISRTTWSSGSEGGIWRTLDGGKTWEEITGDIPFRKPQILRYNAATKTLWAGGVGLFTLKQ